MKKAFFSLLLGASLAGLVSCDEDSKYKIEVINPKTSLTVGEKIEVKITSAPEGLDLSKVNYSFTEEGIIDVERSENGFKLTAKKKDSTTMTVEFGKFNEDLNFTVKEKKNTNSGSGGESSGSGSSSGDDSGSGSGSDSGSGSGETSGSDSEKTDENDKPVIDEKPAYVISVAEEKKNLSFEYIAIKDFKSQSIQIIVKNNDGEEKDTNIINDIKISYNIENQNFVEYRFSEVNNNFLWIHPRNSTNPDEPLIMYLKYGNQEPIEISITIEQAPAYEPQIGDILMRDYTYKKQMEINAANKDSAIAVVYNIDTENRIAWVMGKYHEKKEWRNFSSITDNMISSQLSNYKLDKLDKNNKDCKTSRNLLIESIRSLDLKIQIDFDKWFPVVYSFPYYYDYYHGFNKIGANWYVPTRNDMIIINKNNLDGNNIVMNSLCKINDKNSDFYSDNNNKFWTATIGNAAHYVYQNKLFFDTNFNDFGDSWLSDNEAWVCVVRDFEY